MSKREDFQILWNKIKHDVDAHVFSSDENIVNQILHHRGVYVVNMMTARYLQKNHPHLNIFSIDSNKYTNGIAFRKNSPLKRIVDNA